MQIIASVIVVVCVVVGLGVLGALLMRRRRAMMQVRVCDCLIPVPEYASAHGCSQLGAQPCRELDSL